MVAQQQQQWQQEILAKYSIKGMCMNGVDFSIISVCINTLNKLGLLLKRDFYAIFTPKGFLKLIINDCYKLLR